MAIASSAERYMLTLINQERTSRGLDPLQLEQNLNQAAEDHSEWMLARDVFSHTGASGSSPTQRMRAADFDFSGSWSSAENIAVQSERGATGILDDVADLHTSLMNSPGHRANLLNPDLDYIGIGIERGDFVFDSGRGYDSVIVTQNFASTGGSVDLDRGTTTPTPPPPPPPPAGINGTGGADRLIGTNAADVINGYGGNDRLYGRAGNDRITAGDGNDRVYSGTGNDYVSLGRGNDFVSAGGGRETFNGGAGTDTISYFASAAGVAVNLATGGTSGGRAGDDRITGFENVTGSGAGGDRLYGSGLGNTLKGYGGNDQLFGRAGNDRLHGGAGRDRLDGDAGSDVLFGGSGADVFHFDRGDDRDWIKDFQDNVDTLQLDGYSFGSVAAAMARARQSGDDIVFHLGDGDQIWVEDMTLAQMANDLVLV